MYKYRLYVEGVLHTETNDINVHQKAIDQVYEAGLLGHATEERIKND